MSPSHVVFVDDVLRAPFHDFIPRFFGPDYLGGSRDGGECGPPPAACAQASASARVPSLIGLQNLKASSGGLCDAASAFLRHASSDRGNALAPTTVLNPFLRPAQEPASSR